MAKRKFVSSKKNAPSRAISSKEAALHGRTAGGGESGSESPGSPGSSDGESSTPLSSEDEREQEVEDDDDVDADADISQEPTSQTVAVEVMPATVGRGKQLRFPAVVSRGKESRLLQDGAEESEASDSDDDSLLSIGESDDEDEDKDVSMEVEEEPGMATPPVRAETNASQSRDLKSKSSRKTQGNRSPPQYPIKAARARKRHRPDSEYYKQMSTYVRDCLLSVRHTDSGDTPADALADDMATRHAEFRRRLAAGNVERVTWREPPPAETHPSTSTSTSADSGNKATDAVSHSSSKTKKSKSNKHSKPSKSSKSSKPSSKSSKTTDSKTVKDRKVVDEKKAAANGSAKTLSPPTSTSESMAAAVAPSAPVICEVCKKKFSGEVTKEEEQKVKKERDVKKEPPVEDVKQPPKEAKQSPQEVKKESSTSVPAATAPSIPCGSFVIPFEAGQDVQKLRNEATKLMDEARRLKHEGNRRGSSERGSEAQITQGKYYLRSSAKFFEHALKLQEVKAAYQEVGDTRHAHTYGEVCVQTLTQTSSLIESTIRGFQSAGSLRLAALGCKMASVVHLTVYRLQHRKLLSFYSEVFTPGRSPESRQNGLTPPIDPNSSASSKDAAIRTHLLKEMEHTLRGFEMWRRYEGCKVSVLPRVTNPVVLDLDAFFQDLESELR